MWLNEWDLEDLSGGWLEEGFFPVELCDCGYPRSFCTCEPREA